MPTCQLPENASLEHLKGQAKLVRDLIRDRDEGALSMVDEFHPRLNTDDLDEADTAAFKLSDAQLIVARMYRCASWNELREHVDVLGAHSFTPKAERPGYIDFDESFVELACVNYAENGPNPQDRTERAHQMLAADPALATGSIQAAVTVGDQVLVAEMLTEDPSLVNARCGPNQWPPLLYATYSRIQTVSPDWSAVETVKTLLGAGADPNAGFLWRGLAPPFTALTGAFGSGESDQPHHANRFAIARLLLEAGADPNDGQALYNNGIGGKNHDDPGHLELLLEFGLGDDKAGPWYRRLGSRLGDPADWLHHELEAAAIRNRPNHLRLLISIGADLDQPVGRSQKTPVRLAAEHGNHQILALLADAGLDVTPTPDEQFLEAIRTSNNGQLKQTLKQHPHIAETAADQHPGAVKAVTAQGADVLVALLELGLDINARTGGNGTTALHDAAQANDLPRARLLIEHGADPNLTDNYIGSTPWGWANHYHHDDVDNYLHPLTEHSDPIDVTIHSPSSTSHVTTLDALDETLDVIKAEVTAPTLVRLESADSILTIGIGHPTAVVLYLDAHGDPWHGTDEHHPTAEGELTFTGPNGTFTFDAERTVTPNQARSIAKQFSQRPRHQPPACTWHREGTHGPSSDRNDDQDD